MTDFPCCDPVPGDGPTERTLTEVERDEIASYVYEAYRLGKFSPEGYLPMWHEPESREHVPTVEVNAVLACVEDALAARTPAPSAAQALLDAADALEGGLGVPGMPRNLWEFRQWLRERADRLDAAPTDSGSAAISTAVPIEVYAHEPGPDVTEVERLADDTWNRSIYRDLDGWSAGMSGVQPWSYFAERPGLLVAVGTRARLRNAGGEGPWV